MTAHPSGAPRWVVITPNLAAGQWLEAVRLGAAAAGLTLALRGYGADETGPADIVVTDDPALALAEGAETIVVLVPDPWTAPDAVEAAGEAYPYSMVTASRRLAQVHELDLRHRVIGHDQFPAEGTPVTLFADLVIKAPASVQTVGDGPHRAAAAAALRALYANGRAPDQLEMAWPLEFFTYHQGAMIPGRLGEFDLTGRPKFLVSGPYLWMPSGTWTATTRFSIDDDASDRRYRFDWGSVTVFTEQHCVPEHAGVYEIEVTHRFETADSCEARMLITEGCFSGHADFLGVTIRRTATAA